MKVLVETNELSAEAKAEVEGIAKRRRKAANKKFKDATDTRKRELSPPAGEDQRRYTPNTRGTAPISDGTRQGPLPHDATTVLEGRGD